MMSACMLQDAEWSEILHKRFQRLWQLSAFCDVSLVAGDDGGQVTAHAVFLAAMCGRAWLTSDNTLSTVHVTAATHAALHAVIKRLYTGVSEDKSLNSEHVTSVQESCNVNKDITRNVKYEKVTYDLLPDTLLSNTNATAMKIESASSLSTTSLSDFSCNHFDNATRCIIAERLLLALDELRSKEQLCDIQLGGHPAHRCVVAAASQILQKALVSGHVDELDVSDEAWAGILHYIYTGTVHVGMEEEETVIGDLLTAAHSVHLERLASMCQDYVASLALIIVEDDEVVHAEATYDLLEAAEKCNGEITTNSLLVNNEKLLTAVSTSESAENTCSSQLSASNQHVEHSHYDTDGNNDGNDAYVIIPQQDQLKTIEFIVVPAVSKTEVLDTDGNQCDVCGKCFSSHHILRHHKLRGACASTFPCNHCRCRFRTSERLARHMLHHNAARTFVCPVCARAFVHKSSLRQHEIVHSGVRPHVCKICNRAFLRKPHLKTHQRTHMHACEPCGLTFSFGAQLTVHQRKFHGVRSCIVCGKSMGDDVGTACSACVNASIERDKIESKRPTPTAEETISHICDVCGKNFNRERDVIRHQEIHTRQKLFTCGECGQSFSSSNGLDKHCRQHEEHNGSPVIKLTDECEYCGRRFTRPQDLRRHRRTHTGEKPHTCGVCNRTFGSTSNLAAHIRRHRGDVEYIKRVTQKTNQAIQTSHPCDRCDKKFEFLDQLERHQKEHEEKKFACVLCSSRYKHSITLQRHIKEKHCKENGEQQPIKHQRRYNCDVCSKTFQRTTDLKRHARIHTGEMPFVCDKCGRAFRCGPNLAKHKRRVKSCV